MSSVKGSCFYTSDLQVRFIVATYTDSSGGLKELPKKGTTLISRTKSYSVIEATPIFKFTDGGKTPFTVRVKLIEVD